MFTDGIQVISSMLNPSLRAGQWGELFGRVGGQASGGVEGANFVKPTDIVLSHSLAEHRLTGCAELPQIPLGPDVGR